MSDTAADMLARVGLMARGDPTWDLSARDLTALRYVLKLAQAAPSPSHEPLVAELALSRQRTARLREALKRTTHVLDHWVTEHGCFHPEDASPWNDETHEGIEALIAAKETLAALAGGAEPVLCLSRHGDVLCGKPKGHAWYCGGNGFLWGERGPEGGPDA
jgi:hypothetical protein